MIALRKLCLLAAAVLLSSCISNIGGTIRDGAEERIAVDTQRPVDGVVYRNKQSVAEVMQAPEVVFRKRYGLIYDLFVYDCYLGCPEITDTGRQLWVRVNPDGKYTLLDGPPTTAWKPMKLMYQPTTPTAAHRLNPYATRDVGSKTLRSVLAAPFDYVVDPVLTIGCNSLLFCGSVVSLPFWWIVPAEPDEEVHSTRVEAQER